MRPTSFIAQSILLGDPVHSSSSILIKINQNCCESQLCTYIITVLLADMSFKFGCDKAGDWLLRERGGVCHITSIFGVVELHLSPLLFTREYLLTCQNNVRRV